MKRAALYLGFPYAAGLLAASVVQKQFWLPVLAAVLLIAAAVIAYRKAVWKYVLLSTLSVLTACCVYWNHIDQYVMPIRSYSQSESVSFSGTVVSRTEHRSGYATYLLEGRFDDGQKANLQYFCKNSSYRYGDILTICGKAEEMQSSYLFDAQSYYQSQNIYLQITSYGDIAECTPRPRMTLRCALQDWREKMTERIQEFTDEETGAFMTGMLFGDKTAMSSASKTALFRMGIGHILSVSGLHFDFIALYVARILRKCRVDRRAAFAVMATLSVLFMLCVGESVPVKRACIMILIGQSAGLFFRKADTLNSLGIAMFLLCLENPMIIHSAAFWLSFSGTFGIGVLAPFMTAKLPSESWFQQQVKSAAGLLTVSAAVLPISILYFRELSLVSPIANLLLVPVSMLSMLLTVFAVICGGEGFLAELFLNASQLLAALILKVSAWASALPWTHIGTENRTMLIILLLTAAFVALCYVLWRCRKWMCAAAVAGFLLCVISQSVETASTAGHLRIAVLGEGRHCALVIRAEEEALIVDISGTSELPSYVQAYLQSAGIGEVPMLYLCNPKRSSLEKYNQVLAFESPEQLLAARGYKESMDSEDLEMPITIQAEGELLFHGAVVSFSADEIRVEYAGIQYLCCKEKNTEDENPEILTVYGKCRREMPSAGMMILLDDEAPYQSDRYTYIGENNLELTITPEGYCKGRRLYADS